MFDFVKKLALPAQMSSCFLLQGPNGSGKSTFLKKIWLEENAQLVSFLPQEQSRPFQMTLGLWEEALIEHYGSQKNHSFKLKALLEKFELDTERNSFLHHLSQGQWQKMRLANFFASSDSHLLLDEPDQFLDEKSLLILRDLLLSERAQKKWIFLISHNESWRKDFQLHSTTHLGPKKNLTLYF
jgi:ABC-type Mn2+/Zn2+ transport system ATPase subunit